MSRRLARRRPFAPSADCDRGLENPVRYPEKSRSSGGSRKSCPRCRPEARPVVEYPLCPPSILCEFQLLVRVDSRRKFGERSSARQILEVVGAETAHRPRRDLPERSAHSQQPHPSVILRKPDADKNLVNFDPCHDRFQFRDPGLTELFAQHELGDPRDSEPATHGATVLISNTSSQHRIVRILRSDLRCRTDDRNCLVTADGSVIPYDLDVAYAKSEVADSTAARRPATAFADRGGAHDRGGPADRRCARNAPETFGSRASSCTTPAGGSARTSDDRCATRSGQRDRAEPAGGPMNYNRTTPKRAPR